MHSSRMRTARSSSRLLAGGGSASVHARIPTRSPWVWPWRPPLGVGMETPRCRPGDPSRLDSLTSPLRVGLETPLGMGLENPTPMPDPSTSPRVWVWRPPSQPRPLNFPPGCVTTFRQCLPLGVSSLSIAFHQEKRTGLSLCLQCVLSESSNACKLTSMAFLYLCHPHT